MKPNQRNSTLAFDLAVNGEQTSPTRLEFNSASRTLQSPSTFTFDFSWVDWITEIYCYDSNSALIEYDILDQAVDADKYIADLKREVLAIGNPSPAITSWQSGKGVLAIYLSRSFDELDNDTVFIFALRKFFKMTVRDDFSL